MKSLYSFLVKPTSNRYNNSKDVNGKKLILNTSMEDHKFVNRNAIVYSVPMVGDTNILPGDEVIIHHNIFRRYYDVKGNEKNSGSYVTEDLYLCNPDQLFMYKRDGKWNATEDFCFVKPIIKQDKRFLKEEKEQELIGILKYGNNALKELGFNVGDLIGFTPNSEYEFIIDGERLYRMTTKSIIIKYEYKGNEVENNPSWTQSSFGVN
jgi:hypothetical protein